VFTGTSHLQKLIASLAEDGEAVFQDVLGLHRRNVAVRWRHWIRARLRCAEKTRLALVWSCDRRAEFGNLKFLVYK
jgi:hypothetical protein